MGISSDAKGHLWISDTGNNRVQKWQIRTAIPPTSPPSAPPAPATASSTTPPASRSTPKATSGSPTRTTTGSRSSTKTGEYRLQIRLPGHRQRPVQPSRRDRHRPPRQPLGHRRRQQPRREVQRKRRIPLQVRHLRLGQRPVHAAPKASRSTPKATSGSPTPTTPASQKFNEKGEFVKAVGTKGSGHGQFVEPTGIAVGPGGNVWVTDWRQQPRRGLQRSGEFIRQFGTEGTGNGQFNRPDAVEIDATGNVWVGDQNNERVQEFNQPANTSPSSAPRLGRGPVQLRLPMGIASDAEATSGSRTRATTGCRSGRYLGSKGVNRILTILHLHLNTPILVPT